MNRGLFLSACATLAWLFVDSISVLSQMATEPAKIKDHLLVVFNTESPEARELAFAYAASRNLDRHQIVPISCPDTETITRDVFNKSIREPLQRHLIENGYMEWEPATINFGIETKKVRRAARNDIWAIVLIRGIPLRISHDASVIPPQIKAKQFIKNEAAVDSELALLVYDNPPITGFVPNVYYTETVFSPFDSSLAKRLIMITRLDAPNASDVKRMIRDAIETEKLELTGRAYFDARGIHDKSSGYHIGDVWIRGSASDSLTAGMETVIDDQPKLLSDNDPIEDVALYAGWYSGQVQGPFSNKNFKFRKGAVAYHLHSFSAQTLRNPAKNWVGPLISKGACASMGSVYEPYLRMTPNVNSFFRALFNGFSFAEAAYQSQNVLSWMITMVGDPLYRPFPRTPIESAKLAQTHNLSESPWLCLRIARLIINKDLPTGDKIDRITRMVEALPSSITYEGLGDMLSQLNADTQRILSAYVKAETLANNDTTRVRVCLKRADTYKRLGSVSSAMSEYENILSKYPKPAERFDIPTLAISYATQNGWTELSPNLQNYLAPVNQKLRSQQPKPQPQPQPTKTKTEPTTGIAPRKDLIPPKPSLSAPKVPAGKKGTGKLPKYYDPTRIPSSQNASH
ncbi:MAG: TIGR03790 family protein [Verrucomicrobiota bacterium]